MANKKTILALLLLIPTISMASAIYPVTVTSVYDGDTFDAEIAIWQDITINTTIRVGGIDTPESRTKCKAEKKLSKYARQKLRDYLALGAKITNIRHGKYAGRIIADVIIYNERDLAKLMIESGHARAYDGGYKQPWCEPEQSEQ